MAKLRHYYNGISVYKPTGSHKRTTTKRKKTKGWTPSATNRNKKFLQSINTNELTGHGIAITLTLKECPATPELWHKARKAFMMRLTRKGMTRYHWVTEWQRRGHPHLHMSAYFDHEPTPKQLQQMKKDWCEVAKEFKPLQKSQNIVPITSIDGWLEYSAKHGARGMNHYQRTGKPKAWEENTGRVWGYGGEWPRVEQDTVIYTDQFYKMRRLIKQWRIADARKTPVLDLVDADGKSMSCFKSLMSATLKDRSTKKRKRIASARKLLKRNSRKLSECIGLSEWIPGELQIKMLEHVIQDLGLPHQNQEQQP